MKKMTIKAVSLVLILSMLFLLMVSCVPFLQGEDTNQNSENESNQTGGPIELHDKNSELLIALIKNLKNVLTAYDLPLTNLEEKIDRIKRGEQALHVEFDPSNYYYVCAYYNLDHYEETFLYCCVDEYTWVKYENEKDILEEYKNQGLVVAFQLNKSKFVKDIMSENSSTPYMENFQKYKPEFVDGVNTKPAISYDETFIYLNSSYKKEIYYSTYDVGRMLTTISCVCLDGVYYLALLSNLQTDFGKYYDGLIDYVIFDKYSIAGKNGVTYKYKLIQLSNFVDFVENIKGE